MKYAFFYATVMLLGSLGIGACMIVRDFPWHGWGVILAGSFGTSQVIGNGRMAYEALIKKGRHL